MRCSVSLNAARLYGQVLERTVRHMARYLRRHGAINTAEDEDEDVDPEEKRRRSSCPAGAPPPKVVSPRRATLNHRA